MYARRLQCQHMKTTIRINPQAKSRAAVLKKRFARLRLSESDIVCLGAEITLLDPQAERLMAEYLQKQITQTHNP
jgi:hypothetical protein